MGRRKGVKIGNGVRDTGSENRVSNTSSTESRDSKIPVAQTSSDTEQLNAKLSVSQEAGDASINSQDPNVEAGQQEAGNEDVKELAPMDPQGPVPTTSQEPAATAPQDTTLTTHNPNPDQHSRPDSKHLSRTSRNCPSRCDSNHP